MQHRLFSMRQSPECKTSSIIDSTQDYKEKDKRVLLMNIVQADKCTEHCIDLKDEEVYLC